MQSAFQRIRFCFHGESLSFSEHSHSTGSAPFQQAAFSASRLVAPVAPSGNPNGIPTESPGLRGTRYPGSPSNKHPQPQRGCGPSHHTVARDVRHNPVGVDSNLSRSPKVGAAPTLGWCGRNPFGIVRARTRFDFSCRRIVRQTSPTATRLRPTTFCRICNQRLSWGQGRWNVRSCRLASRSTSTRRRHASLPVAADVSPLKLLPAARSIQNARRRHQE